MTKCITFAFIIQPLFDGPDHNPPNIWIKMIEIAIKIECLHGTKYLDQDCDPQNFATFKQGNRLVYAGGGLMGHVLKHLYFLNQLEYLASYI